MASRSSSRTRVAGSAASTRSSSRRRSLGRILELSTKCLPGQGFQVALEGRAFLAERGIDLHGEQQTKTKTALEYFSRTSQETAAG